MNKAFVAERDDPDDLDNDGLDAPASALPHGTRNYITPQGYARLRAELLNLLNIERPKLVETVSWAAKNGDRSENGDYIYGKRRLREIDRRIRFLTKRLELASIVDPTQPGSREQVFFGASVTYASADGQETTITIVGVDEAEPLQGRISWVAPVARALLKAREGDVVQVESPSGRMPLEVLRISYPTSD